MKKVYKMENLECAHCAAKMEKAINALAGVEHAAVSFMAQKLVIEADEDAFESLIPQIIKICKKIEPDCEVVIK